MVTDESSNFLPNIVSGTKFQRNVTKHMTESSFSRNSDSDEKPADPNDEEYVLRQLERKYHELNPVERVETPPYQDQKPALVQLPEHMKISRLKGDKGEPVPDIILENTLKR